MNSEVSKLIEPKHESFKTPTNKEIKIWRYMDLAQYLAILQTRALFFARATTLSDPFEASSTKPMVALRKLILEHRLTEPAFSAWKDVPDGFFDQVSSVFRASVGNYLVSCWHMNEHESAAMWSLYSRSNQAVCIQSTYRRLRSVLPICVFIGEVRYLDYETEAFSEQNALNFIVHKRKSFEHERELRAVFWAVDGRPEALAYKDKIGPGGLSIEVDASSLIERVYVSPSAAPWFATVVERVTSKYDLEVPVTQSVLSESAVY
jgi:hypothetical protein